MIEETVAMYPFKQPDFDPFQRIPQMQIPPLPNPLNIPSCESVGERIVFPEPKTRERGNLDFGHLDRKTPIEGREFFGAQITPVEDVLLCPGNQFVQTLFGPAFGPASEPDFFELEEQFAHAPQPGGDDPRPIQPEGEERLLRETAPAFVAPPDSPEPAVHRIEPFDSGCIEVPHEEG